ncbi:MAG: hypothetical protein AB7L94_40400 [Kofleriaceae bacterium]
MAVEEWDRRQLCPDGACTGVINATGVCTVCGRAAPNWGDERKRGLRNPTDAPPIVKDEDDILPSAPAALGAMADWGTRRLCSDGGCIGVIGPNNKCKVCGKPGPAKPKAKSADSTDLERVAAEMAGTATAGDLASIGEPAESDEEYEDDDEGDDEYEDDEGDEEEVADAEHDHGDENDADEDDESDDASDEDDDSDDEDDDEDDEGENEDDDDSPDEGDDDGAISAAGDRELCPDGACVGVIGANGRCKVCDKPRDWSEESA